MTATTGTPQYVAVATHPVIDRSTMTEGKPITTVAEDGSVRVAVLAQNAAEIEAGMARTDVEIARSYRMTSTPAAQGIERDRTHDQGNFNYWLGEAQTYAQARARSILLINETNKRQVPVSADEFEIVVSAFGLVAIATARPSV